MYGQTNGHAACNGLGVVVGAHAIGGTFALAFVLLCACSGDGGDPQPDAGLADAGSAVDTICGENLRPHGSACEPILSDCPENHVPVPGGGCERVGVLPCDDSWGIKAPPDWTCTPIGPPRTACRAGWSAARGWCEPLWPEKPCGPGKMEIIGETKCQDVGAPCGSGTWGNIKTGAQTIFVDQASRESPDGSAAHPFRTIAAALAVAASGSHIAVATGTYAEALVLGTSVTIEGRCAKQVKLVAPAQATAAVSVAAGSSTLRGLTVSGPTDGIRIGEATLLVEEAAISGCEGFGVLVFQGQVTLRKSLIARARVAGVYAIGATVALEGTAIHETRVDAASTEGGYGVFAQQWAGIASTVNIDSSVLAHNRDSGLSVRGSSATVEGSVIAGTQARDPLPEARPGVGAEAEGSEAATLVLRDCLVAGNRNGGVGMYGTKAVIERTVIRDTLPQISGTYQGFGDGIGARGSYDVPSGLTISESLVSGASGAGMALFGVDVEVVRTVIKDTRAPDGTGIYALANGPGRPTSLTLRDSRLAGNRWTGVFSDERSTAVIERSVAEGTRRGTDPTDPEGIGIVSMGDLTLEDSLVRDNHGTGVLLGNAEAVIERTVVRDNAAAPDPSGTRRLGLGIASVARKLTVSESVVDNNQIAGIAILHGVATVETTVVRGTRSAVFSGEKLGAGIYAGRTVEGPHAVLETVKKSKAQTRLTLRNSVLSENERTGLLLWSPVAFVSACRIERTQGVPGKDGRNEQGDGISAATEKGHPRLSLIVEDTLVEGSERAGLVFGDGDGVARRSVFKGGQFGIQLGGNLDLGNPNDNVLEGNDQDFDYSSDLSLPPPPQLPPPPTPPAPPPEEL